MDTNTLSTISSETDTLFEPHSFLKKGNIIYYDIDTVICNTIIQHIIEDPIPTNIHMIPNTELHIYPLLKLFTTYNGNIIIYDTNVDNRYNPDNYIHAINSKMVIDFLTNYNIIKIVIYKSPINRIIYNKAVKTHFNINKYISIMDQNIVLYTPTTITDTYIDNSVNKGTGAGGSNTNYYGKKFEEKTNNSYRLLNLGYNKNNFTKKKKHTTSISDYDFLSKTFEDKNIIFVLQNGLKRYIKHKYNIDLFRCPDEAYIIESNTGKKIIKILEKKEQRVEGSVETKLWSGPSLKREYELVLGDEFEVHYAFCVNDFLKNKLTSTDKKYTILNTIFREHNIDVLFGDDEQYFETLDNWVNNSL